jgi:hypothetical protein
MLLEGVLSALLSGWQCICESLGNASHGEYGHNLSDLIYEGDRRMQQQSAKASSIFEAMPGAGDVKR